MNTRAAIEGPSPTVVLSITFNDDCSCFAVGLNNGFRIYQSNDCELRSSRDFTGGIGHVQMMGKANYLGLVGGGRQPKFAANKLILWDDIKNKSALEISALTPVRGVQLSRERIVVVLQNSVRMYKFAKPPQLVSAYDTANNPWGVCSLGQSKIAFPGRTAGHVHLVGLSTGSVSIIPAHSGSIRAIQLSRDGHMLATASETGTLIRVFATSNCARLVELRRGIDTASIFSLAFNPSGTMLACTSDKSTLHIFDVPHPTRPQEPAASPSKGQAGSPSSDGNDGKGKWGFLSKIPLMPRMFSDVYSFASTPFESGEEPAGVLPMTENTTLGTSRPPKGVLGWLTDNSLLVIGAGNDARWEKFKLEEGQDGSRQLVKEGWKRYLV